MKHLIEDKVSALGAHVCGCDAEVVRMEYVPEAPRASVRLTALAPIPPDLLEAATGLHLAMVLPTEKGEVTIPFEIISCGRDGKSPPAYALQLRPAPSGDNPNAVSAHALALRIIVDDARQFAQQFPEGNGLREWHYAFDVRQLYLRHPEGRGEEFVIGNTAHKPRPKLSFDEMMAMLLGPEDVPAPEEVTMDGPAALEDLAAAEAAVTLPPRPVIAAPPAKPLWWREVIRATNAPPILPAPRETEPPAAADGWNGVPLLIFDR